MNRSTRLFRWCVGGMFAAWTLWSVLMAFVGEPFSLPLLRALVRVSVVLIPALAYVHFVVKDREDFWAFRHNWRQGLLVGTVLSSLFFVMIVAQNSGRIFSLPVGFAVWFNFIIVSPLVEEMMFRRVILEHLKSVTSTSRAILLESLLFSLLHLPWWFLSGKQQGVALVAALVSLFVYGVVFSVAVHYTKSIWAALLPHWINNLVILSFST
ncbi:CAAX amino terminal protease self- immunity [Symmachiella dynata]|uniref:CAAX amino terminal protease self-immunity n=1 Tax=Symmachiella dynata TaxID=2527995 RepID=A0A517ZUJ6_9PLAN|nr:CPBP family intramembrane glutamic endopeptidase [Symmachiella dynata]QDU46115.1 CAAX amino terminal protease self- immunity [Symmachiella dynata]